MKTRHRCAICNRQLEEGRYVYSHWTRQRYCLDDQRHRQLRRAARKKETA
jgi:hypothetical protein